MKHDDPFAHLGHDLIMQILEFTMLAEGQSTALPQFRMTSGNQRHHAANQNQSRNLQQNMQRLLLIHAIAAHEPGLTIHSQQITRTGEHAGHKRQQTARMCTRSDNNQAIEQ